MFYTSVSSEWWYTLHGIGISVTFFYVTAANGTASACFYGHSFLQSTYTDATGKNSKARQVDVS
jgi:hypothetical protein